MTSWTITCLTLGVVFVGLPLIGIKLRLNVLYLHKICLTVNWLRPNPPASRKQLFQNHLCSTYLETSVFFY